jgi:hypothetical protein
MNANKLNMNVPYHRDSRLLARPLFATTHLTSYPYPNDRKYVRIKSRYKLCVPFIKEVETRME